MSSVLQNLAGSDDLSAADLVERLGLWDPPEHPGRPHVVAAMIGSADGRATVEGRAGGLGSAADRDVLRELRAAADVMLVGPGTLIAERYATLLDPEQQERRGRRGRTREPLAATISRSLDQRLGAVPLLCEPGTAVQIYTESDQPLAGGGAQIEIERVPAGKLDMGACLTHLHREHGARLVSSEGGPTLLRGLVAAGLIDEIVLTLAPALVAGDGPTVLTGPELDPPAKLRLLDVLRSADHLFLRYAVGA